MDKAIHHLQVLSFQVTMSDIPSTTTKSYAHLEVLNYEKIKSGDIKELERLVQVGKPDGGRGLFFLDLRGPAAGETLHQAQTLYKATARFFDKSSEEKNAFHKDGVENG